MNETEHTEKKNKSCINVLQVIGEMELGGAESRIMDIFRHLDPEKCHYDFLVFNPERQHYDDEIEARGGKIYRLQPRYRIYNGMQHKKALRRFFAEHPEIDIVQGHMTSTAGIYLPIAKKAGVPLTIAHARSAGVDPGIKGFLTKWLRRGLYDKTDVCFSCSEEAALAVFGVGSGSNRLHIIPNAVELASYAPNEENRKRGEEIRESYGLKGHPVIGHIGRFHYAKNHEFLLACFNAMLKKRPELRLLLVGNGSRYEEIRRMAENMGLAEKVVFTGAQSEPAYFYHAMDMLLFPSRYEGLPGTVVEAQAAGLKCLVSDTVTKEVDVTPLTEYLSLGSGEEVWANRALELLAEREAEGLPKQENAENIRILAEKGFDVVQQARMLERLYRQLLERTELL